MSEMTPGVTVCIPSIPPRQRMLERALQSVAAQTVLPERVIYEIDTDRQGAAATRNRALEQVTTEFVAFLDDDDEFLPIHLEHLLLEQAQTGADLVYPWFLVIGGTDPFPDRFQQPFDADLLRARGSSFIPITVLARTEAVRDAGGFQERRTPEGWTNEDWACWMAMVDQGKRLVHLPERTWRWHHHTNNTSGNPERW